MAYSWPGNVRELRNAVERAVILERGNRIGVSALILDGPELMITEQYGVGSRAPHGIAPLAELERTMIRRALEVTGNNQTRAAELLGITRDQLRYRLKKASGSTDDRFGKNTFKPAN
jgi:DNA-binding NtrC family response regulator